MAATDRPAVTVVYRAGADLERRRAHTAPSLDPTTPDLELASARREVEQLHRALANRATIDIAKGVVMAHAHCDADRAFDILRRLSNDRNVKLATVAAAVGDVVGAGTGRTSPELTEAVRELLVSLTAPAAGDRPSP